MRRLERDTMTRISVTLNGKPASAYAESRTLLSDFVRHELGATGTHVGCEHGVCGACTVRLDGQAVRACLTLAIQAEGCEIQTVEGLADGEALSPLQAAFARHFALQCGYCTPGILMSAEQFLTDNPHADEADIRTMLSGHICRCTGYTGIVQAILEEANRRQGGKNPDGPTTAHDV